jgi:hypothetical protein
MLALTGLDRMLRDERMKQLALSLDDEFADLLEP